MPNLAQTIFEGPSLPERISEVGAELYEISIEHGQSSALKKFVVNFRYIACSISKRGRLIFGGNPFRTPSFYSCVGQTTPNLGRA